jgi:hypothetical protein
LNPSLISEAAQASIPPVLPLLAKCLTKLTTGQVRVMLFVNTAIDPKVITIFHVQLRTTSGMPERAEAQAGGSFGLIQGVQMP